MAKPRDFRTKALSDMSTSELRGFLKKTQDAGFSLSSSKELGKAHDLLKVRDPEGFGSKTVQSAKDKLKSSTTLSTRQSLGMSDIGGVLGGGGTGGSGGSGGQPSINLNDIYNQEMNSEELQELESELEAKRRARDEAKGDINDNPFYAEATRTGKIDKLNARAGDDIRTLESSIANRKADAQIKLNIAQSQYNIDNQAYQQNLSRLNTMLTSGALSGASDETISQIALSTGMSTEMVKAMQNQIQTSQAKPLINTSKDDLGNVTITAIDVASNEILFQRSLGRVGAGSSSAGSSGSGGGFNMADYWAQVGGGGSGGSNISGLWE